MQETFDSMIGKTMASITGCKPGSDEMVLTSEDGHKFRFYHEQDCCESVQIEDVAGDVSDLLGAPIGMAEEVSNEDPETPEYVYDSYTWTFYKFATAKGSVTVRWLGMSNGYYSEGVDFHHTPPSNIEE